MNTNANISIDNLQNNQSYYLSSDGEIKKAGLWQKFKCWANIGEARQQVRNLVSVIKSNLLDTVTYAKGDSLNEDFAKLDTTKNLKGSDLNRIIEKFKTANSDNIDKAQAKKIEGNIIENAVDSLLKEGLLEKRSAYSMQDLLQKSISQIKEEDLPKKNEAGKEVFDKETYTQKIEEFIKQFVDTIREIKEAKLPENKLNNYYLDYIKGKLFDDEGNLLNVSVDQFKGIDEAKRDYILSKIGDDIDLNDKRTNEIIDYVISKTKENKGAADIIMKSCQSILLNGANKLRSLDSVKKRIDAIFSNADEYNAIGQNLHGFRKTGIRILGYTEGKAFPPGFITKFYNKAKDLDLGPLKNLKATSSPEEMHKALFSLYKSLSEAMKSSGTAEEIQAVQEDRNSLKASKILFQSIVLLRMTPEERVNLKTVFGSLNFAKIQNMYNELYDDYGYTDQLGRNKQGTVTTLAFDMANTNNILIENLEFLSNTNDIHTMNYEGPILVQEDKLGPVYDSLLDGTDEYISEQTDSYINDNFKGEFPESMKQLIKDKLKSETYDNTENKSFVPDTSFNNAVKREVGTTMNLAILTDAKRLGNGNIEDTSCYKDLIRGMSVTLPGGKKLSTDFETARDEIAQLVTSNNSAKYSGLDKETRQKVNLVLAMMSQETAKSLTIGIPVALDKNGAEPAFNIVAPHGQGDANAEYTLIKDEDGAIRLTIETTHHIQQLIVNEQVIEADPQSYIKQKLSYYISPSEFNRLGKLNLNDFDDTRVQEAMDQTGAYNGQNNKILNADKEIQPEMRIHSNMKVEMEGNMKLPNQNIIQP